MKNHMLCTALSAALLAAGAATAADTSTVVVYDRTVADGDQPIEITGIDRDFYDLNGDGYADAVLSRRVDLPLGPTLDAVADAEWEDLRPMTGTDRKDTAVKMGVATRSAAAVASTDRPGERVNPALESRSLHAQADGQAIDRDLVARDAEVIGVALVPVAERKPAAGAASQDRIEVTGVTHRVADLDGDGLADAVVTVHRDLDPQYVVATIVEAQPDEATDD